MTVRDLHLPDYQKALLEQLGSVDIHADEFDIDSSDYLE